MARVGVMEARRDRELKGKERRKKRGGGLKRKKEKSSKKSPRPSCK